MKKKQLRRLLKTKKKMDNISKLNLSNDEVVNNFAYALETYKRLGGKLERIQKESNKSNP